MQKVLAFLDKNFKWIAVLIILFVVGGWLKSCSDYEVWRKGYVEYADSTKKVLATNDSLKNEIDFIDVERANLEKEVDLLDKKNTSLSKNVSSLKRKADSLQKVIYDSLGNSQLPPECDIALEYAQAQKERADSLDKQVVLKDSTITVKDKLYSQMKRTADLHKERADILEKQLLDLPPPPKPKKFLGLININPTTTFFIGAGLGFVAGQATK